MPKQTRDSQGESAGKFFVASGICLIIGILLLGIYIGRATAPSTTLKEGMIYHFVNSGKGTSSIVLTLFPGDTADISIKVPHYAPYLPIRVVQPTSTARTWSCQGWDCTLQTSTSLLK